MRFDNTIDFKIDKRVRYKSRHITIVNNEFTSLQIYCYFFRAHNVNVNQYFDSKIIYYMYIFLNINNKLFFLKFVFQINIQIDVIEIKMLAIINISYFNRIDNLFNNDIKIQNAKLFFVYQ